MPLDSKASRKTEPKLKARLKGGSGRKPLRL